MLFILIRLSFNRSRARFLSRTVPSTQRQLRHHLSSKCRVRYEMINFCYIDDIGLLSLNEWMNWMKSILSNSIQQDVSIYVILIGERFYPWHWDTMLNKFIILLSFPNWSKNISSCLILFVGWNQWDVKKLTLRTLKYAGSLSSWVYFVPTILLWF